MIVRHPRGHSPAQAAKPATRTRPVRKPSILADGSAHPIDIPRTTCLDGRNAIGRATASWRVRGRKILRQLAVKDSFVVAEHDLVSRALERMSEDKLRLSDALIGEFNRAVGCADTLMFDQAAARSELFKAVD